MKCIDIEELISLYIDELLDEHTKSLLEKHLVECNDCRKEYESLVSTVNLCKELPMIQLPDDYTDSLHNKLLAAQEEKNQSNEEVQPITLIQDKKKKKLNWKFYTSIAAVFILFVISISSLNGLRMGKMASESQIARNESINSMEAPAAPGNYGTAAQDSMQFTKSVPEAEMSVKEEAARGEHSIDIGTTTESDLMENNLSGRKVINNSFVNMDVESYDEKFDQIVNLVISSGGYIEHSDTQYKYYVPEKPEESLKIGNINARVPQDVFVTIVNEIKVIGTVTNFGMGGQDITMQYRDTANEVENLQIQEERLRDIMLKANNVKDILEVERELSRVRGDINRLTGDIKRWDDLVALSTINISLNEVAPKDKKIQSVSDNLWDKAGKGFIRTINGIVEFLESAFIGFVSLLPIILLIVLAGIPIVWFIRRIRRRE